MKKIWIVLIGFTIFLSLMSHNDRKENKVFIDVNSIEVVSEEVLNSRRELYEELRPRLFHDESINMISMSYNFHSVKDDNCRVNIWINHDGDMTDSFNYWSDLNGREIPVSITKENFYLMDTSYPVEYVGESADNKKYIFICETIEKAYIRSTVFFLDKDLYVGHVDFEVSKAYELGLSLNRSWDLENFDITTME